MKKITRLLTVILCLFLLGGFALSALPVSAVGDGDSLSATIDAVEAVDRENLTDAQYAQQVFNILSNRISEHYNKKNAPDSIKVNVVSAITPYTSEIFSVVTNPASTEHHAQVQTDVREKGLQGLYAGTLAWIYYANTDDSIREASMTLPMEGFRNGSFHQYTDTLTLEEYYGYLQGDIIGNFLHCYDYDKKPPEEVYTYFTWLYRAIYEAKLAALSPDASLPEAQRANIQAALDRALTDVRSTSYVAGISAETANGTVLSDGEDGYNFRQLYGKATALIDFSAVYETIHPGRKYAQTDATRELIDSLGSVTHNSEINNTLKSSLDEALTEMQGEDTVGNQYTYTYVGGLREDAAEIYDKANETKVLADGNALLAVFAQHDLSMAKAGSKDELCALLDSLLQNTERYPDPSEERTKLESLVFSAVEILNGCTAKDELALETARGRAQAELYDRYLHAVEKIRGYTDTPDAILEELKEAYDTAKGDIASATRLSDLEDDIARAELALDNIVAEAEAEAYLKTYEPLFSKIFKDGYPVLNSLTSEDRPLAEAAMDATADGVMSALAREKLRKELSALGDAYQYLMAEEAEAILAGVIPTDAKDPLKQTLTKASRDIPEKITAEETDIHSLPALKQLLSDYVDEANAIEDLMTFVEEEIRADAEYGDYSKSFVSSINQTVKNAIADITDTERAEDPSILSDSACLSLERMTATEKISLEIEKATEALDATKALTETEKAQIKEELEALRTAAKSAIDASTDFAIIDRTQKNTLSSIKDVLSEATLTDLERKAEAIKDAINGYDFLSQAEKDVLIGQVEDALKAAKEEILSATDTDGLITAQKAHTDRLDGIDKDGAKQEYEKALESVTNKKDEYSDEQYEKIDGIINNADETLNDTSSRDDYLNTKDQILEEIKKIPDRLDEAYGELLANKESYSAEDWARLEAIYEQAKQTLTDYSALPEGVSVIDYVQNAVKEMRAIRLQVVYTPDKQLASDTPEQYREGDHFWGKLFAEGGLPSNSLLSVGRIGKDSGDSIAERIMRAAKDKRIYDREGVSIPKDLNRLLKDCYVTAGFDVTYTPVEDGTSYSVTVLLPEGTSLEHVIGVVYLNEDGSAEYLELTHEGLLVTFDTYHFSEFYVVCSNVINLLPVIILMTVILAAEIAVLAFLYLRKSRRKAAAPLSAMALVPPYFPANGWMTVLILGIAIVLLGGWIATILVMEQRAKRPKPEPTPVPEETEGTEAVEVEEPIEETPELPEAEEIPELPEAEAIPELPAAETVHELPAAEEIPALPEKEPIHALPEREPIHALPEAKAPAFADPEEYEGAHKGEINLDTLSDHFEEGETVTLNDMKRKRLLPRGIGAVKVLGRGRLGKALTVLAQGFSASAKKKIEEDGGEAIVTHTSKERENQKTRS
ncbi:MAG: uL15 family ribosomal protein [Clostridia bacterium]|nr:uL15 family ribosomal protein [Clostridia bacterium]